MSDLPAHIIIAGAAVTVIVALVAAGIVAGRSIGRAAADREAQRADAMTRTARLMVDLVGHHLTDEQATAVADELARYRRPGGRHAAGGDPR